MLFSDEKSSNLRNTYGVMDMEKENLDGTGWFTDIGLLVCLRPCQEIKQFVYI